MNKWESWGMRRCDLVWLAIGRTTKLVMIWDLQGYKDQLTQKVPVLDDLTPNGGSLANQSSYLSLANADTCNKCERMNERRTKSITAQITVRGCVL